MIIITTIINILRCHLLSIDILDNAMFVIVVVIIIITISITISSIIIIIATMIRSISP